MNYLNLKKFSRNPLKVLGFISKHPLESIIIGATLFGVGCAGREDITQRTKLLYSGVIDSLRVDYGVVKYPDKKGEEDKSYEFISIILPNETLLAMSDSNKDGEMDKYNIFTAGYYIEGDKRTEGLNEEECKRIYRTVRQKIVK